MQSQRGKGKISELDSCLRKLSGPTLITFQSVGDVDAVASSLALAELVPQSVVRATGELNAQSRRLLAHFGLAVPPIESLGGFRNIIVADAGNSGVLGDWGGAIEKFRGKIVVIDHHYHSKPLSAFFTFEDVGKSSTCEIVFELSKLPGRAGELGKREALLLAAGVISDSAFFKSANDSTFSALSELLEIIGSGSKDYEKVVKLIRMQPDVSERLSRLEALRGAQVTRRGNCLVARAHSNAFELSCASMLVEAGCDYAFVGNTKHGRIFSCRSDAVPGNVGKIMEKAGIAMGGSGGGHEKVGGANGLPQNVDKALSLAVSLALKACPAPKKR
ncbi:MAG: DHH family phosphoesterase [Candidatus Micrarchaeia archaeon]|jgi:nanoRNase/pAp phosphatase (c-di-AMP/oligoRNAs hydrolase)